MPELSLRRFWLRNVGMDDGGTIAIAVRRTPEPGEVSCAALAGVVAACRCHLLAAGALLGGCGKTGFPARLRARVALPSSPPGQNVADSAPPAAACLPLLLVIARAALCGRPRRLVATDRRLLSVDACVWWMTDHHFDSSPCEGAPL